jgi:serine/threonine protein kinase
MSEREQTHPDREELAAFGLGHLDEEKSAALEAHLAHCPECTLVLERLGSDSFITRLRAAAATATAGQQLGAVPAPERETLDRALAARPGPTANLGVPPELANHLRYWVVRELGAGGMGVVYEAMHLLMGRRVALKVINGSLVQDPAAVERFQREVRAAARLSHPNIVTAFDAEWAGALHFLVMEYVEGTSLQQVIAERGRLPVSEACDYVRQAALGLQHAHERGMVHRDIKPGNLLLTPEGQIKVLDFGLARFARESAPAGAVPPPAATAPHPYSSAPTEERGRGEGGPPSKVLTQVGCLMGTPDYVAPEQILNPHTADIRADLYSLGCTLYHLLAGPGPFAKASEWEKLMAHSEAAPRPLTEFRQDVPPGLVQLIERLMAKDPAHRYQTPADAARALEPYTVAPSPQPLSPEERGESLSPLPSGERRPRYSPLPSGKRGRGEGAETPGHKTVVPRAGSRLWKTALAGMALGVLALLFLTLLPAHPLGPWGIVMKDLYLICAVLGGTILAFQFLMGLVGLGHHHDLGDSHDLGDNHDFHDAGAHEEAGHAGGDHEDHATEHERAASRFARILTLRTLVAGLTFFGLAGRAASAGQLPPAPSFLIALGAGAGALYGVAWLMRSLQRLRAEGTAHIEGAVGRTGTVYLTIPGARAGAGKVLLNVQNRTVEYQAVTAGASLPTGTGITVVAVVGPGTIEVIPTNPSTRLSHV